MTRAALVTALICATAANGLDTHERLCIVSAERNAAQAAQALNRCQRFVEGWLRHADPETGLFPQNLRSPIWTPENSAADNYPFMVLTAYFTDRKMLNGRMRDILVSEVRCTTRLRSLPDAYNLQSHAFDRAELDMRRLIFGSAEYCKDGLLAVTEAMGRDDWLWRMRDIARDLCAVAPVETRFGNIPSDNAEVNGDVLQVLCRLYGATGDPRLLDMAFRIGDAYFLEVLPHNNGLPSHSWDFAKHTPRSDTLRLVDHGSEIIGGLSEVYAAATWHRRAKAAQWDKPMRRMLDTLLDSARKPDGMWYLAIQPSTLNITNKGTPDTWGYVFNAYYTFFLLTGEFRYRAAVRKALDAIQNYPDWGGGDAFADSIESAIVLLNRIRVPSAEKWVDDAVARMSAKQRPDGVIEGWHGDGNVARTWLLYAMMNTAGLHTPDWRKDLRIGGEVRGDALYAYVSAQRDWSGRLCFDYPRHREVMGLALDYPRLNSFPEWFTVEANRFYSVTDLQTGASSCLSGSQLRRGLALSIAARAQVWLKVQPWRQPPYGVAPIALTGPAFISGEREAKCKFTIRNLLPEPQRVTLATDWGSLSPTELALEPKAEASVTLRGRAGIKPRTAHVIVRGRKSPVAVRLAIEVFGGLPVVDLVDVKDKESYHGETYRWTGDGPFEYRLKCVPGKPHVISLLWGSSLEKAGKNARF
ncbi:MAG: hypothetical protein ACE5O2_07960, partial [Armatimonadota bacterium]